MDLLERIDALIDERHILKHPFYTRWAEGTLPLASLQEYTRQYYAFESNFPRFLSAIHARTESAAARQQLLDNLWDEEHGASNHAELWLRFAEGIGVDRSDVRTAKHNDATHRLVDFYRRTSTGAPVAAAVAAIYAYERQVPQVAESKIEGLERHYDVADDRALAFFRLHGELDVEHSGAERAMLAELATDADEAAVETATRAALDAWWSFLSAVEPAPMPATA
jgi:pyrroloquinoline-quinone synthase